MQNNKQMIAKIILIVLLIFSIGFSLVLTAQVTLSSAYAWTADNFMRDFLLYLEFLLILVLGILTFFSSRSSIFFTSIILAIIDLILSIVFWWGPISIILIGYLLVVALFDYWRFHNLSF